MSKRRKGLTGATVTVREVTKYYFPHPEDRCAAHGQALCIKCARNPGNCANPTGAGGCSTYYTTGMHWDTCPNRIKS